MFGTPAFAQTTAAPAAGGGGLNEFLANAGALPMIVVMMVLFYFLILRPQQKRVKDHENTLKGIKRGDVVVLGGGMLGKVTKVEDAELAVEIATGVTVKAVRSMVTEVRVRAEPAAANDAKTAS